MKSKGNGRKRNLFVATWNVRSLVEDGGDPRVCRVVPSVAPTAVDRKVDFLVDEFEKFKIDIAGVQETKWFGKDIWRVGKSTFLHSGRSLPGDGEAARRNEGVGIMMNAEFTAKWQRGGEQWSAVSSRIITARFLIGERNDVLQAGTRRRSDYFMTVVNVYAPTSKAPPNIKNQFLTDLQSVVSDVPHGDLLVLLGDFNARVGSRQPAAGGAGRFDGVPDDENVWGSAVGQFGLGTCNEAGEGLLMFCAANNLSVMNTWFRKKESRRGTWTHPATRQAHAIDFVMMRADQRHLCFDVSVLRGACCWTDHFLVRAKLNVDWRVRRPASAKKRPFAVHRLRDRETLLEYQQRIESVCADAPGAGAGTAEEKWTLLKSDLDDVAADVLGRGRQTQPDWFLLNKDTLEPLIATKRRAHATAAACDTPSNRKALRSAQRAVGKAVRSAKESWINAITEEAEGAQRDGSVRWKCIKKLQGMHSGRKPAVASCVRDENGNLTDSPESLGACWHRHFDRVLNVESAFDVAVIESLPSSEVRQDLDEPPTLEEVVAAIRKLHPGTAGGQSGIVPEMVLSGGEALHQRIHNVITEVWTSGAAVADWRNAEIVPIPKKGDLRSCDNWRGISLLDVVGKVFARVLQGRLQAVAEDVLPDSQCGFRKGRGCSDMVFTARQLMEKAVEHDSELYVLFVDLRKAYDSIPRSALWLVLRRLGIPPTLLGLVRSLHEGMEAHVRLPNVTTGNINVRNGLRQGCTLAPTLFNLYFSAVVSSWRQQSSVPGVQVRYRIPRKLVGDRTAKARLDTASITESQFADDAALYTTSLPHLVTLTDEFVSCASRWGLTVSVQKTKAMAVNCADPPPAIPLRDGRNVEVVDSFTYLGSVLSANGTLDKELTSRLAKASRAFGSLQQSIFQCRGLSIKTKRTVYRAIVLPTLFYGAETWPVKARQMHRLNIFHRSCIRSILGVSKSDQRCRRLTSAELAQRVRLPEDIGTILREYRLRWLGHVARMDAARIPQQVLFGELPAKRPRHGPKKRWRDAIVGDLRAVEIPEAQWYELAQDRPAWRGQIRQRQPPRPPSKDFLCACGRPFRGSGDLKRHLKYCPTR